MPNSERRFDEPSARWLHPRSGAVRPLVPAFFTCADAPWLQCLLDERARFVGQRRAAWRARTQQGLPMRASPAKLRIALDVLERETKDRVMHRIAARHVRAAVFRAAVHHDRQAALMLAAEQLGSTPQAVLDMLFADLPDERLLAPLPAAMDAAQVMLLANELMVQRLLQLALKVRIVADGNVRAVVRHAKWVGLLCVFCGDPSKDHSTLEVSGPYALFRHTRLYGRALASLLPRLARCNQFQLEADCVLGDGQELARLTLRSGDPIHPARELPLYDSRVEARFAREFSRLAHEWDVIREPQPVAAGASLCFPDFQLRRRTTGECYWLEIVGYWTAEYLRNKLAQLEQAQLDNLILCVDEARSGSSERIEGLGRVVWYKRWVDARAVIAIVDPALSAELTRTVANPSRKRSGRRAPRAPQGREADGDRRAARLIV